MNRIISNIDLFPLKIEFKYSRNKFYLLKKKGLIGAILLVQMELLNPMRIVL